MNDTAKQRPLLAVISLSLNGLLTALILPGLFALITWGRVMPGFRVMAWFLYVFPWVNILSIPLALLSERWPKLLRFTLWAGIGGILFDLYLVLAMLLK